MILIMVTEMKIAVLSRFQSGVEGTFGLLWSGGFSTFIIELPWRDNEKQKSCIPVGLYLCEWRKSPRFGWCYQVTGVPGRSNILIHSGNYAGSVDDGFKSHSYGCLLPASKLGILDGQKAGLISKPAVRRLNEFLNKEPFLLEIRNAYDNLGSL